MLILSVIRLFHDGRRAIRHVCSTLSSKLADAETASIHWTWRRLEVLNAHVTSPTPPKVNYGFTVWVQREYF